MRRAVLVLLLAAVLALPSARATGFDFTSGRSFAQPPGEGGVNHFTIPFHANVDGFVYVKMLDTPANAAHNGQTPNGSAAAKTGWWIEWAITRGGATQELGARNDGTPTELVPVKAGEDGAIVLRVHWPAAANVAGAKDLVYAALAFRADQGGNGPGAASGAQMDEARSFHVEIDMTGGAIPVTPPTSSAQDLTPSAPSAGTDPTPSTPPQSPTPDVGPIASGGGSSSNGGSASSGGGSTIQLVTQQASLPSWVVPMLVGEGVLVVVAAVLAIVISLRPQRIEIVMRNEPLSPIRVEGHASIVPAEPPPEPSHSITVREK